MSRGGWWALCGAWLIGVGVFWALWFQARAQRFEAAAEIVMAAAQVCHIRCYVWQ